MARIDQFTGLTAFLAVAEHRNFRQAAVDLGVTRAAVSQAIKALEQRVGQPLFLRTTRSVALTEAGQSLLETVRPASARIGEAIEQVSDRGGNVVGVLRVTVPRIAMDLVMAPLLLILRQTYPDLRIDIDVNDASIDLSSRRYDAGIRIGEFIERDMIAVRLTPNFQWTVVGSPDYFARCGVPGHPRDLIRHECIRYRFPTAASIYRWEFVEAGADFTLEPPGHITVNDHLSMIEFARRGVGLAYTADLLAASLLDGAELQAVLRNHLPTKQGLFLYFPANAQRQRKLRAFIDTAKLLRHPPT
jgi:DNA-binding transcriptional LysR family regulator